MVLAKPRPDEFHEYYGRYISLVPDGDILQFLDAQIESYTSLLRSVPEERETFRYAPDKWSIREVAGHVNDCDRVFVGRSLAFARADVQHLPGFEQDDYVKVAGFDRRTLLDLREEFALQRKSALVLYRSFTDEDWLRRGIANDAEFSTRSIPYILAGHVMHHMEVLKERYL